MNYTREQTYFLDEPTEERSTSTLQIFFFNSQLFLHLDRLDKRSQSVQLFYDSLEEYEKIDPGLFQNGNLRKVVVHALRCDIIVSEFELQLRYYLHFGLILLEMVWTPYLLQLWVKYYLYCSSTRISLVLKTYEG